MNILWLGGQKKANNHICGRFTSRKMLILTVIQGLRVEKGK